ncbi:hypothetical protein INT47_006932, partial [Mucor saturninus]
HLSSDFLNISDLTTYKATFKTANKYLKYFCDNPASDWSFKKYKKYFRDKDSEQSKKIFVGNLQTVKDDSKNISSLVNRHISKLMESFNPASNKSTLATNSASNVPNSWTVYKIKVKGNYYNASGDITIHETAERDIKKQKTNHKDKGCVVKQKWVDFLADAEQNKNFHRYSPEKNGVTRLGAKLSPHPNADKDIYRNLKKQLKSLEPSDIWMEAKNYIGDIVAAAMSCLEKTMKTIAVLKSQHEEKLRCYDNENNSQEVLLSDIICPRIFKLSYNTHGQHFANEHSKSSPESDY